MNQNIEVKNRTITCECSKCWERDRHIWPIRIGFYGHLPGCPEYARLVELEKKRIESRSDKTT